MESINTTASTKKQKQNNKNMKLVKSYPCPTLLIICLVGRELHSESCNIYFFVSKQMCKMFYGNIFASQTLMDIQLMWLSHVVYVNILYWPQYFSWNEKSGAVIWDMATCCVFPEPKPGRVKQRLVTLRLTCGTKPTVCRNCSFKSGLKCLFSEFHALLKCHFITIILFLFIIN